MSRFYPSDRLLAVLAALQERQTGASVLEIAAAIHPIPPMRNLQRWLATLVRQKRIRRMGGYRASGYRLADRDTAVAPTALSPVGQALHVLVSQPLAERPLAEYRRLALDAYRPNQTFLLPVELRQRLGAVAARSTLPAPPVPAQNRSAAAQPGGAAGAALGAHSCPSFGI